MPGVAEPDIAIDIVTSALGCRVLTTRGPNLRRSPQPRHPHARPDRPGFLGNGMCRVGLLRPVQPDAQPTEPAAPLP